MILDSAELAAERVRKLYWNGLFPIDPVKIAASMGVKVLKSELPPEVSGAIIKQQGQDAIIYLSADDSDQRKRFTCAHELGHFYQHLGDDKIGYVDLRHDTLSAAASQPEEIFANQFAAHLLMPETEIKRRCRDSKVELTAYFGVSAEALKYRLMNLKIKHPEFE